MTIILKYIFLLCGCVESRTVFLSDWRDTLFFYIHTVTSLETVSVFWLKSWSRTSTELMRKRVLSLSQTHGRMLFSPPTGMQTPHPTLLTIPFNCNDSLSRQTVSSGKPPCCEIRCFELNLILPPWPYAEEAWPRSLHWVSVSVSMRTAWAHL